jgi:SAM-dependent methyltransferase
VSDRYEPAEYWSTRLGDQYDLRGTGHLSYSHAYNRWLYRAKRRALRKALPRAGASDRALDLGSGTGWVVQELVRAGYGVDGCDIAPLAVSRLRTRFPEARFFELTLGADPLPADDASCSVVTALDVMYHVDSDEAWRATLAEVARVLRPGGVFLASDGFGSAEAEPAKHVRFRSRALWAEATAGIDLREERLEPYFRWLSRDRDGGRLSALPDGVRGATEYALETLARREPHMRLGVFARQSSDE